MANYKTNCIVTLTNNQSNHTIEELIYKLP